MQFDWSVEVVVGVALVTVRLRNETGLDREARVRNELDGPVLPPRREGTSEAGWDREGVTVVVDAGDSAVRGYACPLGGVGSDDPTARVEPPATLASIDSPTPSPFPGHADSSVDHALRSLGDPRPPRAVIDVGDEATTPNRPASADSNETSESGDEADEVRPSGADIPGEADALVDSVRKRVAVLESLEGASVDEATEILGAHGGLSGVETLVSSVEADAEALGAVAADADTDTDIDTNADTDIDTNADTDIDAERISEVTVLIAALRRLA